MKRILIALAIILTIMSCENRTAEFPDYDAQTVYFPIQYPVRTIVLGESRSDNSIDLEHAFHIGVSVGGVIENTKDRTVSIRLAPELADSVIIRDSDTLMMNPVIKILPTTHYENVSFDQITIPSGSFNGLVRINLTDAFFNDPLAVGVNYVIPLVITSAEDSVLTGVANPDISAPDRRLPDDWVSGFPPRDYTLFGVKFINKYHGTFLTRGLDTKLDAMNGSPVETRAYHERYNIDDIVAKLSTLSMTQGSFEALGGLKIGQMQLTFDEGNKSIAIDSIPGDVQVWGSGSFLWADDAGADVWGGRAHMTLFLDYQYRDPGDDTYHHAVDTLVYRDNDVVFEQFALTFE